MFKLIKFVGKYFTNISIFYILDGYERKGDVIMRTHNQIHEAETFIVNGRAKKVIIEIKGESESRDPVQIDELLLGYDKLARMR